MPAEQPFNLARALDDLPIIPFGDRSDFISFISSVQFKQIFDFYMDNYATAKLKQQDPLYNKIALYLYLTGQGSKFDSQIGDVLYRRKLPTITEFLKEPQYLGASYDTLYPYWRETLDDLFSNESTVRRAIFAGATSTGKSTAGRKALAYAFYRLMCYRYPRSVLGVDADSILSGFIISDNLKLVANTNLQPFISLLQAADGFEQVFRGQYVQAASGFEDVIPFFVNKSMSQIEFPDNFILQAGSQISHTVSNNIYCSIVDELNERRTEDAINLLTSIDKRLEGRFKANLGLIFQAVISSSRDKLSPLETYIDAQPKGDHIKVFRPRQWDTKTDTAYIGDGTTFPVLVGNDVIPSRMFEDAPELLERINNGTYEVPAGCELVQVPNGYKADFEANLVQSIQDIIGAVIGSQTGVFHNTTQVEDSRLNPELRIECNLNDAFPLIDKIPAEFWIETPVGRRLKRYPNALRYLHCDLASAGGDSEAGLGLVHKEYTTDPETGQTKTVYVVDMSITFFAQSRIDIELIMNFIIDLVEVAGVKLHTMSCDQYQSVLLRELIRKRNIITEVKHTSVDITTDPYDFTAAIAAKGELKAGPCKYLRAQMNHVIKRKGKIERTTMRKDQLDGLCGAIENARKNIRDMPTNPYVFVDENKKADYTAYVGKDEVVEEL